MFNEIIKLIGKTTTVDDYGDLVEEETSREVFAKLASVTQSEFYQAQAVGLKPEIKFILADYLDYNNEQEVRYAGYDQEEESYSVIRTYRNNTCLELVCKRGVD